MDPEAWLEAQSDINTDLDFDLDLDDLEDGSGDGGVDDVGSGGPEWVEGSFSSPAGSLAGRVYVHDFGGAVCPSRVCAGLPNPRLRSA